MDQYVGLMHIIFLFARMLYPLTFPSRPIRDSFSFFHEQIYLLQFPIPKYALTIVFLIEIFTQDVVLIENIQSGLGSWLSGRTFA